MTTANYDRIDHITNFAARLGATHRVSIYPPVHRTDLMPTWAQMWEGMRRLLDGAVLLGTTEGVVLAALAPGMGAESLCVAPGRCSHASVSLLPDGRRAGCPFAAGLGPEDSEPDGRLPPECQACPFVAPCQGGCRARRLLTTGLDAPDPYCPREGGHAVRLTAQWADESPAVTAAACGTWVRAA